MARRHRQETGVFCLPFLRVLWFFALLSGAAGCAGSHGPAWVASHGRAPLRTPVRSFAPGCAKERARGTLWRTPRRRTLRWLAMRWQQKGEGTGIFRFCVELYELPRCNESVTNRPQGPCGFQNPPEAPPGGEPGRKKLKNAKNTGFLASLRLSVYRFRGTDPY